MDTPETRLAHARLKAAELRTRAAHQAAMAKSYRRQAQKPSHNGQEEVCSGKAGQVESLADQNLARADLIEAEAEARYRADTGLEAPPKGRA